MQGPDAATDTVARLEDRDITAMRDEVLGCRESGHARANNYDIGVWQVPSWSPKPVKIPLRGRVAPELGAKQIKTGNSRIKADSAN